MPLLTVLFQIVSMQTLHYLTLSIIIPPLLAIFAEPKSLAYEGGAANVGNYDLPCSCCQGNLTHMGLIGMIMDWREMAGRPTVRGMHIGEKWWAWSGGKRIGQGWQGDQLDGRIDPIRGWIIAFCWLFACSAE